MDTDPQTLPSDPPRAMVHFDGACPLCRAEIAHYRKCGSQAAFADLADGGALPSGVEREAALRRFHVTLEDGQVVSGAAAFAALWRRTPGWRWAGRIGGAPPFVWIGEGLYRLFLPLRPVIRRVFFR
jgi:predicted DCC family thiol-disulfide oxidoreductase YuxK